MRHTVGEHHDESRKNMALNLLDWRVRIEGDDPAGRRGKRNPAGHGRAQQLRREIRIVQVDPAAPHGEHRTGDARRL